MATILLSTAGAAIGGSVGGTLAGLSSVAVGRAVGATLGRVIDQRLLGHNAKRPTNIAMLLVEVVAQRILRNAAAALFVRNAPAVESLVETGRVLLDAERVGRRPRWFIHIKHVDQHVHFTGQRWRA